VAAPRELPARTQPAEDAFVAAWLSVDDPDEIAEMVETAVQARRMQLAARLVGLLGDKAFVEPGSDLEKAQRAAALFLMNKETPEDRSWSVFEDAWGDVRRRRMKRIKARMRASITGQPSGGLNRLGKKRR
jgi:hypothetical protein